MFRDLTGRYFLLETLRWARELNLARLTQRKDRELDESRDGPCTVHTTSALFPFNLGQCPGRLTESYGKRKTQRWKYRFSQRLYVDILGWTLQWVSFQAWDVPANWIKRGLWENHTRTTKFLAEESQPQSMKFLTYLTEKPQAQSMEFLMEVPYANSFLMEAG